MGKTRMILILYLKVQSVQKIMPDSKVKNIFLTLSLNIIKNHSLITVYALNCTLVQYLLSEQDSLSI